MDEIQESLDTLMDWEKDWQMQFNIRKCKMMEMGRTMKIGTT